MTDPSPFDRAALEQAFERLGSMALAAGRLVEISVYGGSALVLTFPQRPATRDVDAVFEADRVFVRRAARIVGDELGWGGDWINDGVKGFLSQADSDPDSKRLLRTYPADGPSGLRVLVASPAYLFAMKCLAMRAGGVEGPDDKQDIRRLAAALGIDSVGEAIAVVMRYYPATELPPKTRFGLEEIFGEPGP
jgi:hypothetical protein